MLLVTGLVFAPVTNEDDRMATERLFSTAQDSLTVHDPIAIHNDTDFVTQGWPGSGTLEDPYLISGLNITCEGTCINITDTTAHFIIEDCYLGGDREVNCLDMTGVGIWHSSVHNATVKGCHIGWKSIGVRFYMGVDCTISGNLIQDGVIGGYLTLCENLEVYDNTVINYYSFGFRLSDATGYSVMNNQFCRNGVGLVLMFDVNSTMITSNAMIGNHVHAVQVGGHLHANVTFHSNRIGWNYQNVRDDGGFTKWDDGISQGNWWDDYSGIGVYNVSGLGKNTDNYPMLLKDEVGPDISVILSDTSPTEDEDVTVTAEVTDPSGVREAILSISTDDGQSWANQTMERISTDEWTYSLAAEAAGTVVQCKVYALDYAENWEDSQVVEYTVHELATSSTTTTTGGEPTTGDELNATTLMLIGGVGAAVVLVALVVVLRRR